MFQENVEDTMFFHHNWFSEEHKEKIFEHLQLLQGLYIDTNSSQ